MIKRISILCVALLCAGSALAQTTFLSTAGDAKSLSLGGAAATYGVDGFSAIDNIAATVTSDKSMGVGASYLGWQPSYINSKVLSVAGFYKVGERLAVGASYQYDMLDKQDVITSTGSANGSFRPSGMVASVGAAYMVCDGLSVGANLNYLSTAIYTYSDSAVGADLHVNYAGQGFAVALLADNLGLEQSMVAVAGSATVLECGKSHVGAMAKVGYVVAPEKSSSPLVQVGAEYVFAERYFARVGYSYTDSERYMADFASVGVGVALHGVALDFAYLIPSQSQSPIGGSFMVSASFLMK